MLLLNENRPTSLWDYVPNSTLKNIRGMLVVASFVYLRLPIPWPVYQAE